MNRLDIEFEKWWVQNDPEHLYDNQRRAYKEFAKRAFLAGYEQAEQDQAEEAAGEDL